MHTATAVPSPLLKAEIRAQALQSRRAFARALTREMRELLERRLLARVLPHLAPKSALAAYHPMKDEIDPTPILSVFANDGNITVLPWFADRETPMMFRMAPAEAAGPWGVLQPPNDAPAVRPDVILVPLVAADLACNRIGHGKGHYDRALADLRRHGPVRTIGLAWDIQVLDAPLPTDPWDIPLDAIATPDRWIEWTTA